MNMFPTVYTFLKNKVDVGFYVETYVTKFCFIVIFFFLDVSVSNFPMYLPPKCLVIRSFSSGKC